MWRMDGLALFLGTIVKMVLKKDIVYGMDMSSKPGKTTL